MKITPFLATAAAIWLLATPVAAERGSYAGGTAGVDILDVDVMFVGAHPDDESGVLSTFARYVLDEGFRASVVTLTSGEGGGNATGREAGRALGLIRREEERRALALIGVEPPHFLGLEDFYFTLVAEEAAERWGSAFVCDVVRHVRMQRPEVIVTMWPGPGTHGQHQMAARAATLAFHRAGDAAFCPEHAQKEFVAPFEPAKLYYFDSGRIAGVASVPSDTYSRAARTRYADLEALAFAQYRSQGYDRLVSVPVKEPRPETFLLVRSRVPASPEGHLLEGALLPAGTSPPGVRLVVDVPYEVPAGQDATATVTLVNGTMAPLEAVTLALDAPEGWTANPAEPPGREALAPAARKTARFVIRASPTATGGEPVRLRASYAARHGGGALEGANAVAVRAVAPVQVAFRPLHDVAGYRAFARETATEWVIPSLPARIPLPLGRPTPVTFEVVNRGRERARGVVELELPEGVRAAGEVRFDVAPGSTAEVQGLLEATEAALPPQRHSTRRPVSATVSVSGLKSRDAAELFVVPRLTAPRVAKPPVVDGDLADMQQLALAEISPKDVWWRREPSRAADLAARVRIGWDAEHLYVGLEVTDDVVVCNIAPDDVRAQLRSDAVGITVDPSGRSRDTSTTLQAAAFPCTTEGFAARAFRDADARPGLVEETAPGTKVASRRTADGYAFEAAIPWSAMPAWPRPGDEIGLNVVLYDGDDREARVGANVSESGLAWSAFEWGGKQALPYLWPRVILGR